MTDQTPAPLTTAETDVRDLDCMMLNVERLLASELWALATGEEFKAAVGLWCRAWKQIPAGSLPDDQRVLASFAGVTAGRWARIAEMALRGFVRCADGRLYHRVLCEEAVRAYARKTARRQEAEADLERKRREREDRAAMFEVLRDAGETPAWNTPTRDLRQRVVAVTAAARRDGPEPVTGTGTVKTGRDGTGRNTRDLEEPDAAPPPKGATADGGGGGSDEPPPPPAHSAAPSGARRGDATTAGSSIPLVPLLEANGLNTAERYLADWRGLVNRQLEARSADEVSGFLRWAIRERKAKGLPATLPSHLRPVIPAWHAMQAAAP